MIERMKNTNLFQRVILAFLAVMLIVFTVIYPMTVPREGFLYSDTILVPTATDGVTTYMGKDICFKVFSDNSVEYTAGDKTYGLYTLVNDLTAVPQNAAYKDEMTGVELFCGEVSVFRGGMLDTGEKLYFYDESGMLPAGSAEEVIMRLMNKPVLTHKGTWLLYIVGLTLCVYTAASILYRDEIFRFSLLLRIRGAAQAQPSDWELFGRYLGWCLLPAGTLLIFIIGLG